MKESTKKGSLEKVKLKNVRVSKLFLWNLWLSSFSQMSKCNIPFHPFFKPQVYHLGSNYNNRRADLDIAIKKVSPVEQQLIYQSCYICIPVKVFTRDA